MAVQRPPRFRSALSGTRGLARLVYRDPVHVAERLTLYAAESLGEQSHEWAQRARGDRPGDARARLADDLIRQSGQVARIDGAIAGTPFLIALVPGYLAYLWQEARMSLRMAALYDKDPTTLLTAAEVLVLRGVHPTVGEAEQALHDVQDTPLPAAPSRRRPWRVWFDSVYRLLVFGGLLAGGESEDAGQRRLRRILTMLVGTAIWVTTWVLPVTFMLAMSWNCESHTRELGRRARDFYADDLEELGTAASRARSRRNLRRVARSAGLVLSVAIPIAFVAYVNHIRNTVGITWLGAIGALVALSLVAATSVAAARR